VEETILYSASLESFLATSSWNHLYGGLSAPFRLLGPSNLFPGLVLPGLVLLGVVMLARRRERPSRTALALAVMAVLGALVALGPEIRLFDRVLGPGPFALARNWFPVFRMIRVTSRAGVFVALPLAVLAACALTRLRPRPWILTGVTGLALAETLIAPIPMPRWMRIVDTRDGPPPVDAWLAAQPGATPVVHLPMLDVRALLRRPPFHESVYMVHSMYHWKPLVNGYAGIEPASYVRLRALARDFPSDEFLDALREIGVRYVVLHRKGYGPYQWPRIEEGLPRFRSSLREAARFGPDSIFELQPKPGSSAILPSPTPAPFN
jgi:hypothetical protein